MTTDPPPPVEDMEDVKILQWQSRLPSAICTNKEIFDEIFSLETWKTVLGPDQRDRILKMLPPELFKVPGAVDQTIQDLFQRTLTSFNTNPLDTLFDKLENGHYDPEVVETKANIVREWRRDSFRLRKLYHTKLLQDIVISRDKTLRKLLPPLTSQIKKNSKKNQTNSISPSAAKKAAKALQASNGNTNGYSSSKGYHHHSSSAKHGGGPKSENQKHHHSSSNKSSTEGKSGSKNKRGRQELLSPPPTTPSTKNQKKDPTSEGPSKKKAKTSPKSKSSTPSSKSKKGKTATIMSTTSSSSITDAIAAVASPPKTSLLLGTLTTTNPLEPPTLSLRSPPGQPPPPPSALLDSLTSTLNSNSQPPPSSKFFTSSPVSTSSTPTPSPSFLPSPVQSSPILASQLQAPSPISVNLSTITGSSRDSNSNSLLTLNYTQPPTPTSLAPPLPPSPSTTILSSLQPSIASSSSIQQSSSSSSDEFEFEGIEATIGFSGPSPAKPKPASISKPRTQEVSTLQKCSLLTNCLTQPLSSNSSSNAAVSAALANNILTSAPVPATAVQLPPPVTSSSSTSSVVQQLLQHPPPQHPPQKIVVSTPSPLPQPIQSPQPILRFPPPGATFTQKQLHPSPLQLASSPGTSGPITVDAQTFVSTLMAHSKDLLSAFSNSALGASSPPATFIRAQLPPTLSTPTSHPPIISLQPVTSPKAPSNIVVIPQTTSTLTSSTLQLPSSILSSSPSTKIPTTSLPSTTTSTSSTLPNLLDNEDLTLSWNLDLPTGSPSDPNDCVPLDKMDDLSNVLDGNPFDSIPNLSDELDGLDLDMVDGLCDFEVLLGEEKQYSSFFSLIRDVLCSTRDHRMTLVCLEKTIKKWAISPAATLNSWYMRVPDWTDALVVALNFLAGNYQDVHPEDFVPYIEYKYKTKYYQWIGAGRDGDNNLTPLCTLWLDNLDKLPPLRKSEVEGDEPEEEEDENEDSDGAPGLGDEAKKRSKRPQTPPPPRCATEWSVRPSTELEKGNFRNQEKARFENPHKAFTYRMHGYESVVGPVKGVYSSQTGLTNKARGHSLLVDDRPPYVTILALVRDAVARLPNGEGTRSEICEMLRDSAFLAPEASNVTLNSVVSGALDRLHYERDPCVRYDSHKKSWIYLHRDRSQEQFERLHHNRSYTKSTKSRNNSNRKSRKGSKSSTGSASVGAPAGTSSSSSSQCSTSAIVESALQVHTQGLVAVPPLGVINQKIATVQTATVPTAAATATVVAQAAVKPQQQAIGIVNVAGAAGAQGQLAQTATIQVPVQATQQQSLNEVLAAAAGLRFQGQAQTVQVLGAATGQVGQPQGQATFIQDPGQPGTARLVLQQGPPQGAQQQQNTGQILLGNTAAAVLKLAGRLGEGLRFAQLRLPGAPQAPVQATQQPQPQQNALRLPQHRILLARGTLPGQPQGHQGVLLGQTSTGQTVILSAGPAGSSLAGLQQALAAPGQITLAAAPAQSGTPQQAQLQVDTLNQQAAAQQQQAPAKYGIITNNVPQQVVVSSSAPPSYSASLATRLQQSTPVSTLPSTSISLPANLLAHSTSLQSPPPNVTVTTSQLPPLQSAAQQQQQQTVPITQSITAPLAIQQQQQQQQSLILQQSAQVQAPANAAATLAGALQQHQQNASQVQQQGHPLTTAPIIIRSAQGDFVSFGIPSHLSLGRGMQGIKVIPFQSGKQTVLARIVAPPPTSGTPSSSTALAITSGVTTSSVISSVPASSVVTSSMSSSSNTTAAAILSQVAPQTSGTPVVSTPSTAITTPTQSTTGGAVTVTTSN